jgi:hypothetical protein
MLGLFCPLEEYVGPSIVAVGVVFFGLYVNILFGIRSVIYTVI